MEEESLWLAQSLGLFADTGRDLHSDEEGEDKEEEETLFDQAVGIESWTNGELFRLVEAVKRRGHTDNLPRLANCVNNSAHGHPHGLSAKTPLDVEWLLEECRRLNEAHPLDEDGEPTKETHVRTPKPGPEAQSKKEVFPGQRNVSGWSSFSVAVLRESGVREDRSAYLRDALEALSREAFTHHGRTPKAKLRGKRKGQEVNFIRILQWASSLFVGPSPLRPLEAAVLADATAAVEEELGGQRRTEHMARGVQFFHALSARLASGTLELVEAGSEAADLSLDPFRLAREVPEEPQEVPLRSLDEDKKAVL